MDLYDFGYKLGDKDKERKLPIYEFWTSLKKEDKNTILESIKKCCSSLDEQLPDSILKECSNENTFIKSSQKILIGILAALDYNSSIPNLINQGRILSIKKASIMFGKSPSTIRRDIENGKFNQDLEVFKIDSKVLIYKSSLIRVYGPVKNDLHTNII
ncbi:DeoR family transcriptional regulator [Clostridioides difficile]|uniref:DeoR family transcriptional regulator n=1 Tax=Clostridioides difficile TaxID=1496 RepID=UPI0010351C5F|nr:DeoR family transcriptional regulator [Clostridioides difficile]MDM9944081.1 DeoR family transcriptional regulator [Clostridioides difficile]